jgi:hypothetical protein
MSLDNQLDQFTDVLCNIIYRMSINKLTNKVALSLIIASMFIGMIPLQTYELKQFLLVIGTILFGIKLAVCQNLFLRYVLDLEIYAMYIVFIELFGLLFAVNYPITLFYIIVLNNLACLGSMSYISFDHKYYENYDHNKIAKYLSILFDTNLYGFVAIMIVLSHAAYTYNLIKVE